MRKNYHSRKTRHIVKFSSLIATALFSSASAMAEEDTDKTKVAIPTADTTVFIYNGNLQTYSLSGCPLYSIIGDTHTAAGEYDVTVALNDPTSSEWEDGSVDAKTYTFVINKMQIEIPSADTSYFVYNGAQQAYSIPNSEYYTAEGQLKTDAGVHEVVVALNDTVNCEWADATIVEKTYRFTINKLAVEIPAADTSKFTYNGVEQVYTIVPSVDYTVSGNFQSSAGNHAVYVSLSDSVNYEWADGTSEAKIFDFEIAKAILELPKAVRDTFVFDGLFKAFDVVANDKYTVGITNAIGAEVGSYERLVSINNPENYIWEDNTSSPKAVKFFIVEDILKLPKESEFTYTGDSIDLVPSHVGYNIDNGKALNVGEYSVKLQPNPGYKWEDGTKDTIKFIVKINPILIEKPRVNSGEVTYDGSFYSINVPENQAYTISGNSKAVEPGDYPVVVSLKPNYAWSDTTTEDLTYLLQIARIKVEIPSADTTVYYYNRKDQTYSIKGNAFYTVEGNSQSEIGSYDVIVTLNDTVHYEWADSTIESKHFTFNIIESNKFEFDATEINADVISGEELTVKLDVDGAIQYYKIDCDQLPELRDSLIDFDRESSTIKIPTSSNMTPGSYKMDITLVSGNIDSTFSIEVTINYPASNIIVCWNDVIAVDHSKVKATTYQWYKDGSPIPGATGQYYCDREGLCGYYMCEIDGGLKVGPTYLDFGRPLYLTARGETGKIVASVTGNTTAKVLLLNVGGMVTDSKIAAKEMVFNVKPGIYVLTLDGTDQSVKVIVK